MLCTPLRLSANTSNTHTASANGVSTSFSGYECAVDSIQGCSVLVGCGGRSGLGIGRQQVANAVQNAFESPSCCGAIGHGLAARAHAVPDVAQTAVCAPACLAFHTALTVGCAVATVATLPGRCMGEGATAANTTCAKATATSAVTMGRVAAQAIVTPMELLAPEVNIGMLRTHEW